MTTAWPKNAVELSAPHCLSDFGACASCGQPVHTTSHSSAVHTATGLYACTVGYTGTVHGAELDTTDRDRDIDDEIATAEEAAATEARETERSNVGYDLGRKLESLQHRYLDDEGIDAFTRNDVTAILDAMHDWLVDL